MAINPDGAALRQFMADDDGQPLVMLNLLRFVAGGRERYAEYAQKTAPFLREVGGELVYFGSAHGALVAEECDFVGLPQDEYTDRFTYARTDRRDAAVRRPAADHGPRRLHPRRVLPGPRRRPPRRRGARWRETRSTGRVGGAPERVCPPRPSGDGVEGGEFVSWIYVEERGEKR